MIQSNTAKSDTSESNDIFNKRKLSHISHYEIIIEQILDD